MRKIFITFLICIFSLWLMPLTAFVKPAQDALVCNGQRAICLCRHQAAEGKVKPSQAAAFQSSAETQKESSGGMSPRFLVKACFQDASLSVRRILLPEYRFLYSFRYVPAFEHVPKAA